MTMIRPFRGLRPAANYVAEVIAPPYDVLNSAEARQRAENKPWSFLHISKPEIDLAADIDPYSPEVYAMGAANFQRMQAEGVLQLDPAAYYYVYRLQMGNHQQTGLVAAASVQAYLNNKIRKHELTQPAKVADRMRQISALSAQTGPVLLAYKANKTVTSILAQVTNHAPEFDVVADDGIRHQLWAVRDTNLIAQLTETVNDMDALYIADGHHRSEAAAQLAQAQQHQNDHWQYFLTVMFPDDELQILGYHRVIKDLHGLTPQEFLQRISEHFIVTPSAKPVTPQVPGEWGMYLNTEWYRLNFPADQIKKHDPIASLDVSILANYILEPILNIHDPRRDPRIDFVGGIRGLGELEKRVNSGEMAVAFALYPTRMSAIMQVADAHQIMPPKSTWFEPKLADGMVSHVLNIA